MNHILVRTAVSLLLATGMVGSGRAQDTDKVRETVKRLESVLSQVDTHLAERATTATELDDARAQIAELRQRLTVAMTQVKARERDNDGLRADLARGRSELEAAKQQTQGLRQTDAERRQREADLLARIGKLEADSAAKVPADVHSRALDAERQGAKQHARSLEAARAELVQGQESLALRTAEVAELRKALQATEQTKHDVAARDAELADLRQQLATTRQAAEQFERRTLEQAAEQAAATQAAARERLAAQNARDEMAEALRHARESLGAEAAKGERQTERIRALTDDVQRLGAQIEAAGARQAEPPVQIHHHGSGDIILQIPARPALRHDAGAVVIPANPAEPERRIHE